MKKNYLKLQLKSVLKSYPAILLITLITIIGISAAAVAALILRTDSENKQKISIGVVGDVNNTFFDLGIYALENLDSSQFYIDVEKFEEEDAIKALKKREISGYVDIPEKYIDNIFSGKNNPAEYITLNTPQGFGTILSGEIAETVSEIVTKSQIGMYSMQDVAHDLKTKDLDNKINMLTMNYIDIIMCRKLLFDINNLGIADSLSFGGYYICGLTLFFLLLWGISCNKIFSSKSIALSRLLKSRKINTFRQLLCEYTAYLFITLLTLLIFATLLGIIVELNDLPIPELSGSDIGSCIFFVFKMFPAIILITSMQFAFYEIVPHTVGSVIMQFILALGLGYLSGCFYPNYFFPEVVQQIAYYLPSGIGFSYLRKIMLDSFPAFEFLIIVLYTTGFAFIAICARNYRIAGELK